VARYEERGAVVLQTDRDGMVELRTDGGIWRLRTALGPNLTFP
jgi:beta-lactamase superfamily II metal-dependent hydrolase